MYPRTVPLFHFSSLTKKLLRVVLCLSLISVMPCGNGWPVGLWENPSSSVFFDESAMPRRNGLLLPASPERTTGMEIALVRGGVIVLVHEEGERETRTLWFVPWNAATPTLLASDSDYAEFAFGASDDGLGWFAVTKNKVCDTMLTADPLKPGGRRFCDARHWALFALSEDGHTESRPSPVGWIFDGDIFILLGEAGDCLLRRPFGAAHLSDRGGTNRILDLSKFKKGTSDACFRRTLSMPKRCAGYPLGMLFWNGLVQVGDRFAESDCVERGPLRIVADERGFVLVNWRVVDGKSPLGVKEWSGWPAY